MGAHKHCTRGGGVLFRALKLTYMDSHDPLDAAIVYEQ